MKYKGTKRGRFSRKAGGWAQGGFRFSAFVVGEERSHPRLHLFRVGKKNSGERLFCIPLLSALKGQVQNLVPRGIRMSLPSKFMAIYLVSYH